MPLITTKELVEEACCRFLEMGVGPNGTGHVIIRSGALGACVAQRGQPFSWIDAYWSGPEGASKVVDVTGAYRRTDAWRAQLSLNPPNRCWEQLSRRPRSRARPVEWRRARR